MPHITLFACATSLQIKLISIHAQILLKPEIEHDIRGKAKLEELREKMESVLMEYFNYTESEVFTDHQFDINTGRAYNDRVEAWRRIDRPGYHLT